MTPRHMKIVPDVLYIQIPEQIGWFKEHGFDLRKWSPYDRETVRLVPVNEIDFCVNDLGCLFAFVESATSVGLRVRIEPDRLIVEW